MVQINSFRECIIDDIAAQKKGYRLSYATKKRSYFFSGHKGLTPQPSSLVAKTSFYLSGQALTTKKELYFLRLP